MTSRRENHPIAVATRLAIPVNRRRTRTRIGPCVLGLVAAMVLATAGAWRFDPWPCDRVDRPAVAHLVATRAVADARIAGAGTWAPAALHRAEDDLRRAEEEVRRQEVRLRPLRDFREARARLHDAVRSGEAARDEAVRAAGEAESAASEAIHDATELVSQADASAGIARLKAGPRKELEHARQALAEARLHHREGRFIRARERAEEASRLAQRVFEAVIARAGRYGEEWQREAWRRMVAETVAWSAQTGRPALVVSKEGHEVTLYQAGEPVRTFRADIGRELVTDKWHAGDAATPEGRYRIILKKGPRHTKYYKALLLDYPNEEDRVRFARLKRRGLIPRRASPGGLIEIHGHGGQGRDWTDGCVALSNADMDVLFDLIPEGTPVTIVGGDGGPGPLSDMVRALRRNLGRAGEGGEDGPDQKNGGRP